MSKLFLLKCKKCKTDFERILKAAPKGNTFCSRSCAGSYNRRKRKRTKRPVNRSKLEFFLEKKLSKLYPGLCVFNDRKAIRSELDIYIPSLKLAIEINGPTHYRAIYGQATLKKTQRRDKAKATKCKNAGISLHIIDVSSDGDFTDDIGLFHLSNIQEIIELIKNNSRA